MAVKWELWPLSSTTCSVRLSVCLVMDLLPHRFFNWNATGNRAWYEKCGQYELFWRIETIHNVLSLDSDSITLYLKTGWNANDLDANLDEHTGWRNKCFCLVPLSLLRTEEDLVWSVQARYTCEDPLHCEAVNPAWNVYEDLVKL